MRQALVHKYFPNNKGALADQESLLSSWSKAVSDSYEVSVLGEQAPVELNSEKGAHVRIWT